MMHSPAYVVWFVFHTFISLQAERTTGPESPLPPSLPPSTSPPTCHALALLPSIPAHFPFGSNHFFIIFRRYIMHVEHSTPEQPGGTVSPAQLPQYGHLWVSHALWMCLYTIKLIQLFCSGSPHWWLSSTLVEWNSNIHADSWLWSLYRPGRRGRSYTGRAWPRPTWRTLTLWSIWRYC